MSHEPRRTDASEGIDADIRVQPESKSAQRSARNRVTAEIQRNVTEALRGDGPAALQALRAADGTARATPDVTSSFEAFGYLRVSSDGQTVRQGASDGYSIPAQRQAVLAKAEQLGVPLTEMFVEMAESARTANRPELQRLLTELRRRPSVRYLIVAKIDRFTRNRQDDIPILTELRTLGVQLVSATEPFDDTPQGWYFYGMLAEQAQYFSGNLGQEVKKGMNKKAELGGTPFRAPIGYLNKQRLEGKNDIRWVELDPERAPLVRWCLQQFATGDWTVLSLLAEATKRGLRTLPRGNTPAKALSPNGFNDMLKKPYYMGVVVFRGATYQGTHEPLIDPGTWLQIQDVLTAHETSKERSRKHPHYLKGSIFCADCGARLLFSRNKGNGGTYDYFFCANKNSKRQGCTLPYLRVERVEAAIETYYQHLQMPQATCESLQEMIGTELRIEQAGATEEARRQKQLIATLKKQRKLSLDAHYAGAIPHDLLRDEQDRITRELAYAEAALERCNADLTTLTQRLNRAITLVGTVHQQYLDATKPLRRMLNQGLFEKIYINARGEVERAELTELFAILVSPELQDDLRHRHHKHYQRTSSIFTDAIEHETRQRQECAHPNPARTGHGSSKRTLVGVVGIEPTTKTL